MSARIKDWQLFLLIVGFAGILALLLVGLNSCTREDALRVRTANEIAEAACQEALAETCSKQNLDVVRVCRLQAILEPIANGLLDAKANAQEFGESLKPKDAGTE